MTDQNDDDLLKDLGIGDDEGSTPDPAADVPKAEDKPAAAKNKPKPKPKGPTDAEKAAAAQKAADEKAAAEKAAADQDTRTAEEIAEEEEREREVAELMAKREAARKAAGRAEEEVVITLHESKEVPPGGQFVSVNGRGVKIPVGKKVKIKRKYLEVLQNGTTSVPVKDENTNQVVRYQERRRFNFDIHES